MLDPLDIYLLIENILIQILKLHSIYGAQCEETCLDMILFNR